MSFHLNCGIIYLHNVGRGVGKLSTVPQEVRDMMGEMITYSNKEIETFVVANKELWDNEDYRNLLARKMKYLAIDFQYENGKVIFKEIEAKEYHRLMDLKKKAWERYYAKTQVKIENKKMDALLSQLKEYKEIEAYFPYYTRSSDTVIFLFPKDIPEKDWVDIEICDAVIYDRNYQEYFKVKLNERGVTEVFTNEVPVRTGLGDGGYMVRLRGTCIIDTSGTKMYLIKDDVELSNDFTEEELEQALNDCYGKSLIE